MEPKKELSSMTLAPNLNTTAKQRTKEPFHPRLGRRKVDVGHFLVDVRCIIVIASRCR